LVSFQQTININKEKNNNGNPFQLFKGNIKSTIQAVNLMRKLISRLSANKALFNIAKCIFPDKIELLQKQIISVMFTLLL